ncbi:MAG: hypothetical protein AAB066_04005 [Candidatus Margulisiibacteriota bacterium]
MRHLGPVVCLTLLLGPCIHAADMFWVPNRDPFTPVPGILRGPGTLSATGPTLAPASTFVIGLTGVIYKNGYARALLSVQGVPRIVKVQDRVGALRVFAIENDRILLQSPSKTFILEVGNEITL